MYVGNVKIRKAFKIHFIHILILKIEMQYSYVEATGPVTFHFST